MIKNPHKVFEDYLSANDGRYTAQKRAIVDEIFKIKTHFEVDDFIDHVRINDNRLSRATVYRTIKQLLDAGLLQKIATRDGKVFYERSVPDKHHDHVICNICGRIFEIKEDVIDQYVTEFCDRIGFLPEYRSLHIYGQCNKCNKKTKL
ncbi:transcriptional repressor [bacterium]|nr:transcriptional repressor [bacterium]